MGCKEFRELMQRQLDGALQSMPTAFHEHRNSCETCRGLYADLIKLQASLKQIPGPRLTEAQLNILARSINHQLHGTTKSGLARLVLIFERTFRALRWQRIMIAGGLAAAAIMLMPRMFHTVSPLPENPQLQSEMEVMLEEHAYAMDSGVFQGTSQYAVVITATERER